MLRGTYHRGNSHRAIVHWPTDRCGVAVGRGNDGDGDDDGNADGDEHVERVLSVRRVRLPLHRIRSCSIQSHSV